MGVAPYVLKIWWDGRGVERSLVVEFLIFRIMKDVA